MKNLKTILLLFIFQFFCNGLLAQSEYKFVYIGHEIGQHRSLLSERLKKMKSDAEETGDVLIIYLSTGMQDSNYGLWSFTNVSDTNGNHGDSDEAFNEILAMIQGANSLPINAPMDLKNIVNVINQIDFKGEGNDLKYDHVSFDFYVGSRFWRLGFNNKIIAHLYTILDIQQFNSSKLSYRVFVPKSDTKFKYQDGMPFGDNNLQGINSKVKINLY